MKYKILVTKDISRYVVIDVEADDEETAQSVAKTLSKGIPNDQWKSQRIGGFLLSAKTIVNYEQ